MRIVIDGYSIDGTAVEVANLLATLRDNENADTIALTPMPEMSAYSYYGTRMDTGIINEIHSALLTGQVIVGGIKSLRAWARVNAPGDDGLKKAKLWVDAYGEAHDLRDWTNQFEPRPEIYYSPPLRNTYDDDLPF